MSLGVSIASRSSRYAPRILNPPLLTQQHLLAERVSNPGAMIDIRILNLTPLLDVISGSLHLLQVSLYSVTSEYIVTNAMH